MSASSSSSSSASAAAPLPRDRALKALDVVFRKFGLPAVTGPAAEVGRMHSVIRKYRAHRQDMELPDAVDRPSAAAMHVATKKMQELSPVYEDRKDALRAAQAAGLAQLNELDYARNLFVKPKQPTKIKFQGSGKAVKGGSRFLAYERGRDPMDAAFDGGAPQPDLTAYHAMQASDVVLDLLVAPYRMTYFDIRFKNIKAMYIRREPLSAAIEYALDRLSFGTYSTAKAHDQYFHLSLCVQLLDDRWFALEKNEVVAVSQLQDPRGTGVQLFGVALGPQLGVLTPGQLMNGAISALGGLDNFVHYSAFGGRNCQNFVRGLLRGVGLYQGDESAMGRFVFQPVERLLQGMPSYMPALADAITSAAAAGRTAFSRMLRGGKKRRLRRQKAQKANS